MRRLKVRRGVSEVLAAVVLTAVTLTVGSVIWAFAQSATIAATNDYINGTFTTMKDIIERFTVEHVGSNTARTELYVSVYNYGDVPITVDIYATINGYDYHTDLNIPKTIGSKDYWKATLSITASSGSEVAVKVYSRRQNIAYYTYYTP